MPIYQLNAKPLTQASEFKIVMLGVIEADSKAYAMKEAELRLGERVNDPENYKVRAWRSQLKVKRRKPLYAMFEYFTSARLAKLQESLPFATVQRLAVDRRFSDPVTVIVGGRLLASIAAVEGEKPGAVDFHVLVGDRDASGLTRGQAVAMVAMAYEAVKIYAPETVPA